jgi:hypothetical protein
MSELDYEETSQATGFLQEFPVGHTYAIDTSGVRRPIGGRITRKHKQLVNVPKPKQFGKRPKIILGPLGDKTIFARSDIDGRIAAALDKLFRSKSQSSSFVLKILQDALIGHIFETRQVFSDATRYLRTAEGMVQISSKPSYRAVRLIVLSLKGSSRTSFRLPYCIKQCLTRTRLL